MSVVDLMRDNIRALEPYKCARDEAGSGMRVYLDANENWAPIIDHDGINRYPDSSNLAIRQAAEKALGIPASMSCAGNGSDELIDILIRIFCNPGRDCILTLPPTYGEYGVLAAINDVEVVTCPLREDFSIDEDAVMRTIDEKRPKLTFLCSPNNPSGNLLDRDAIMRLAEANAGITVVDHAYIDFAPQGELTWKDVEDNERLVILRTLSKAWALAGARIGLMIAAPEILAKAYDVKYPYNIPLPSSQAAVQALSDVEGCRSRLTQILANRSYLARRLSAIDGVKEVLASDANFFLIRVDEPKRIYESLKKKGIVVRDRSGNLHCEGCLRITVGSREECDELAAALEELL